MISDCEIASVKDNHPGKRRARYIPALGEWQEASFCVRSLGYTAFSFIRETLWFLHFIIFNGVLFFSHWLFV